MKTLLKKKKSLQKPNTRDPETLKFWVFTSISEIFLQTQELKNWILGLFYVNPSPLPHTQEYDT